MNQRIFLLALLSLAGCGGSGSGGGGPPVPVTILIPSTTARDGDIRSNGGVTTGFMFVGDFDMGAAGVSARAVVGFDLAGAGIPPGATIQTATLVLHQGFASGTPYTDLGNIVADHVNLGAAIDFGDYNGGTLAAAFGVFSTDAALAVKSLEVGAQVQADLTAGRTFSDFRLRFTTDSNGDSGDDFVEFNDAENTLGVGPKPALTVTYLP